MSDGFADPVPPPDAQERMKAQDLKGQVCLIRPTGTGEWEPKEGEDANKKRTYVECEVWTLDRAGILAHESGVRISWWRAVEQLKGQMNEFVGAKPTEQEDRSVVLVSLTGDARKVAADVVADLNSKGVVDELGGDEVPPGEEAF